MGNLSISQVASNQNSKEDTINDATNELDIALTEMLSVDLSAGNVTLTSAQYQQNLAFKTTGNAVSRNLTIPAVKRAAIWIKNGGTATLNIKVGTTTLTLAAGAYALYATDGTANGLEFVGLTTSLPFISLSDAPTSYSSKGRFLVRVNAAENAVEFVEAPFIPGFFIPGTMSNGQLVYKHKAIVPFSIPASGTGSTAKAGTASTGNVGFDIQKNGSSVGTVTFNISVDGSFTVASQVDFAVNDILDIYAPSTADASLADVWIGLKCFLT